MDLFPKYPHCGLFCGITACGKTKYVLDLLATVYIHHFNSIVFICPTFDVNKTYTERLFIKKDLNIYFDKVKVSLNDSLEKCFNLFKNEKEDKEENVLFVIDDCSAEKDAKLKNNMLSKLAFSGRHYGISVWMLSQKYNSVSKDFREQIKLVVLFYCKDRDTFDACLDENDVIENKEEKNQIKQMLKKEKYLKFVLKTDVPTGYKLLL